MNWFSIGSDNGLSLVRCQAITWISAGLLSIVPSGTKFSEIWIKIHKFSFMKMHLKIPSAKWQPFCPGGDELRVSLMAHGYNLQQLLLPIRPSQTYFSEIILKKIHNFSIKQMHLKCLTQNISHFVQGQCVNFRWREKSPWEKVTWLSLLWMIPLWP